MGRPVPNNNPELRFEASGARSTVKSIVLALLALSLAYVLLRRLGVASFITYNRGALIPAMEQGKAKRVLRASVGKRVRIVFTDRVAESVDVVSVDEEGFEYSGPNPSAYSRKAELVSQNPPQYWTFFATVASIDGQS
jgi:hypothetical protein